MITFSRTVPGVYDPPTGAWSDPTTTTITGEGIVKKDGDPARYLALNLILAQAPTIFFTPHTNLRAWTPEFVMPGDTTVLNGITFTVRDVAPFAPDGKYVVTSNIIVSV